jgi:hypothetical protein
VPKIIRYEFMGSWFRFWVLCLTVVGIPFAILYLINGTLRIEHELEDPESFVEQYRSGKLRRK